MKKLPLLVVLSLVLALVGAGAANAASAGGPSGLSKAKVALLLELQHPGGLNRFVRRVSDPNDPLYRHYSTVDQLVAKYGAKPKVSKRVTDWFAQHGVHATLSPTHTFVMASLPKGRAERILPAVEGAASASSTNGAMTPRAIPAALAGDVARISVGPEPTVQKNDVIGPAPAAEAEGGVEGKGPYGSVLFHSGTAGGCPAAETGDSIQGPGFEPFTPNQYLTAYGATAMHARGLNGEGQSVAVVEQGGFKRSDIETYDKCFGVKKTPKTSTTNVVGGKPLPGEDETTLDLEQLSVGAPGLDHIYVYEAPQNVRNIVLAAGEALGNSGHHPDVISISLGICEPQLEGALAWRNAIDDIFAIAGGSGISVLVASGDQGSTGCRAYNLENEAEQTAVPLEAVSMPSSSPYATAVGGTNLSLTKSNKIHDQIVWNDSWVNGHRGIPWGGSGGLSIISPRTPWWQKGIHGYGPGRKVPDLSALADRYPGYAFYCSAAACDASAQEVPGWGAVGGTSAATPLTASEIALVNQGLEEKGEPTVGFLNPLLYGLGANPASRKAAFNDVSIGNDNIFRALSHTIINEQIKCCSARPGYDWASGWGSLQVPSFESYAMAAYQSAPVAKPVAMTGKGR